MSDEIKIVDPDSTIADDAFHASFEHPHTYIGQATPKNRPPSVFLHLKGTLPRTEANQRSLAIVMERHELLELGRYIVRVLDRSPDDRILESLERIEGILENSTLGQTSTTIKVD